MHITETPKCTVGILDTPIQKLERLSQQLGIQLYIKRDDLNGLAFGGNKLRKLDYFLYEAQQQGATRIITYGSNQSNHGRLTAAAAAKFGMKCAILMDEMPPEQATGSLLIDRVLGADIYFMDDSDFAQDPEAVYLEKVRKLYAQATETVKAKYEAMGETVYIIPEGGSSPLGAVGYFQAAGEIQRQIQQMGLDLDYVVTVLGSTGTFGGLILGSKYYGANWICVGADMAPHSEYAMGRRLAFINRVSKAWDLGIEITMDDMIVDSSAGGSGYNATDAKTREYIYMMARNEGIILDPCYTAKAFGSIVEMARSGRIPQGSRVLLIHTGGTPGIFAQEHVDAMQEELWSGEQTVFRLQEND